MQHLRKATVLVAVLFVGALISCSDTSDSPTAADRDIGLETAGPSFAVTGTAGLLLKDIFLARSYTDTRAGVGNRNSFTTYLVMSNTQGRTIDNAHATFTSLQDNSQEFTCEPFVKSGRNWVCTMVVPNWPSGQAILSELVVDYAVGGINDVLANPNPGDGKTYLSMFSDATSF